MNARIKIGEMETEVLDEVVEDMVKAGIVRYLEYLGYTEPQARDILNGPKAIADNLMVGL
jgi:hypothetical protein